MEPIATKNIYCRDYVKTWKFLFTYELSSLIGRIFINKKPPKKSRLLHLGCGDIYLNEFVNADFFYLRWIPFRKQSSKYDWLLDFRYKFKCPDNYWEGVFTEHTLEHLHYSDCLKLFKELHRTMAKGSWFRICVPGLEETLLQPSEGKTKAEIMYNLTQNHGHVSVWDADLMAEVLRDAGFGVIHEAKYLSGANEQLIKDSVGRSKGSLYVEAQK